jgi:serine/alanine adding enzyme
MSKGNHIISTEKPDPKKWNDFVYNHPLGNIFQTSLMYGVYKATPCNDAHVIALEDEQKNIVGILVYFIIQEPGIKSYFSTRAIVYGGPLVSENKLEYAETILSIYRKKVRKTNAIYTEVRNLFDIRILHPSFCNQKFVYEDHMTIHNNLEHSVEEMEKALHRGRASNIKRAIKKNVTVRQIVNKEDIILGHDLICKTYERINLPSPHIKLFLNTADILKDNVRIVGAYLDGKLIGCRVYLVYKFMMYDWFAAVDREYSGFHPSDLMPWDSMLWGKENGYKIYDFAGAGKPGVDYSVRDYKLKFGGELLTFGRYKLTHKPILFTLGVLGMKLYRYIR